MYESDKVRDNSKEGNDGMDFKYCSWFQIRNLLWKPLIYNNCNIHFSCELYKIIGLIICVVYIMNICYNYYNLAFNIYFYPFVNFHFLREINFALLLS